MMALLVRPLALGYLNTVGPGIVRVKTFLKCSRGYIKADVTGVKSEVFNESTMKGGMKKAKLAINIEAEYLSGEKAKVS